MLVAMGLVPRPQRGSTTLGGMEGGKDKNQHTVFVQSRKKCQYG